jgi:hypothetical protein
LCRVAEDALKLCGPNFPKVFCADMMEAPLMSVGILVLTSQCWDEALQERLHERLAADTGAGGLRSGAVVIDYSDALSRRPEFVKAAESEGFASWNPFQRFFVFRKV